MGHAFVPHEREDAITTHSIDLAAATFVDNGCRHELVEVTGAQVLSIDDMYMGADARGGVGIWVGEYTDCLVRNLVIECDD